MQPLYTREELLEIWLLFIKEKVSGGLLNAIVLAKEKSIPDDALINYLNDETSPLIIYPDYKRAVYGPLKEVPLYINHWLKSVRLMARWRLSHNK